MRRAKKIDILVDSRRGMWEAAGVTNGNHKSPYPPGNSWRKPSVRHNPEGSLSQNKEDTR